MDTTKEQLFVKMVLDAWHTSIKRTETLFSDLSDEGLQKEVSGGRNTGVYLLGHLIAVHDRMISLLGLGESQYPELFESFVAEAQKPNQEMAPVSELKTYWKEVHAKLDDYFNKMAPEDWFKKHTSVSEEDFEKEPHRNRLNVIISRTNHLEYHRGQLIFLKEKSA